jgi:hypothetical protein
MRIGFGLAIFSLALVGGCQSEQQTLAEMRKMVADKCNSLAKGKTDIAAGFDVGRYCSCTADKVVNGRSSADLNKLGESKAAADAAFGPAAEQCAAEQMSAVVAAQPAAPAPTAGPAGPAEAVEEPAEEAAEEAEGTE